MLSRQTFFVMLRVGWPLSTAFLIIVFSAYSHAAFVCARLLAESKIPIHRGDVAFIREDLTYNSLGSGILGGTVYRVTSGEPTESIPPSSYLEKHYFDIRAQENEFKSWVILRALFKNNKELADYGLIRYEKTDKEQVMKADDVQGVNVASYLEHQTNPYLKADLLREYETFLNRLANALARALSLKLIKKIVFIQVGDYLGRPALRARVLEQDGEEVQFFLHAKNVLVTQNGLTIIDPN